MLFASLTVNNVQVFNGQPCFAGTPFRHDAYLGYSGLLLIPDTQGSSQPAYSGLGERWPLAFIDSAQSQWEVPLDAVPNQSVVTVLDSQNTFILIQDQDITTSAPTSAALPIGADQSYLNQSFLAPSTQYVETGYWVSTYSV